MGMSIFEINRIGSRVFKATLAALSGSELNANMRSHVAMLSRDAVHRALYLYGRGTKSNPRKRRYKARKRRGR